MSTKSAIKNVLCALAIFGTAPASFASEVAESWVGVVDDFKGYHDSNHQGKHDLKFTRSSDGESFYITAGDDELQKVHLRADQSISVRIDGRITSKFLFFGGNLVVDRFEKLADVAPITHKRVAHFRGNRSETGRRNH